MRLGVVGDVLMRDDDAAGVGLKETHDVVQGNTLADAAAAENADGFAVLDVEAHVVEDAIGAERLGDVLELNIGARVRRLSHGEISLS